MEITQEQIQEWKKKHGELFQITVEDKACVLRKPTRKDLSYAGAVKDPIKMSEVMLRQLWVAGDEEIQTDDQYFLPAIGQMEEVMKVKEAEIKKL